MRKDRNFDQLRDVTFETNVNLHAEGSCLVKFGNTHVVCTASIDEMKELREEGIETEMIPWLEDKNN